MEKLKKKEFINKHIQHWARYHFVGKVLFSLFFSLKFNKVHQQIIANAGWRERVNGNWLNCTFDSDCEETFRTFRENAHAHWAMSINSIYALFILIQFNCFPYNCSCQLFRCCEIAKGKRKRTEWKMMVGAALSISRTRFYEANASEKTKTK